MLFLRSLDASPLLADPDPARTVRLVAALESATVSLVTLEDRDATPNRGSAR